MSHIYYISPVGADTEYGAKRDVLNEISNELGVEWFFPLDRYTSFDIPTALEDLRAAALVLVDLSLERPSCYFELGLAQALGVPLSLIAKEGTVLHQAGETDSIVTYQDLRSYRIAVKHCLVKRNQSAI
ncbi:MAG: hypothetical protein WCL60_12540 [Methylococcales bacterium]